MPIAAEDVAVEEKTPDFLRRELHMRGIARDDLSSQAEPRHIEPMQPVESGELEIDRHAFFYLDLLRREVEPLGQDLDGLHGRGLWRHFGGHAAGDGQCRRRQRDQAALLQILHQLMLFPSGCSSTATVIFLVSESTLRQPRPLNGCAGSQATGPFFGTECATGNGHISPIAAWWAMCPVIW